MASRSFVSCQKIVFARPTTAGPGVIPQQNLKRNIYLYEAETPRIGDIALLKHTIPMFAAEIRRDMFLEFSFGTFRHRL